MTLGFKEAQDFKGKILSGVKIHSIREDKKKRWRPGVIINMVTGNRTKQRSEFKTTPCVSVQQIEIIRQKVFIDNRVLLPEEVKELVVRDGFDYKYQFFEFFNKRFNGVLIHWTNFRY